MIFDVQVNYWAIIVAALVAHGIGFLWYGPLFGKQWMKLMNFTPKSIKQMSMTPMKAISISLVVQVIVAYVLAHFVRYVGAVTFIDAIQLAFWLWLGFSAPLLLASYLWEGKSFKLWVFNASHRLIELIVMATILSLWH